MPEKEVEQFKSMSLGDHLEELRLRLILAIAGLVAGLGICFCFGHFLLGLLVEPYYKAMKKSGLTPMLQAISPAETFMVYMKTCLLFGLIISSPWIFWQLWLFVSAGLYKNEKRLVKLITPLSAALFITGSFFFLEVIAPVMMKFFVNFRLGFKDIQSAFSVKQYVDFITGLTLIFGLTFQSPIVIVALNKLGIVSTKTLQTLRKYVILAIVTVAALLTPEMVSLFALAVPLYLLYEISIIFCAVTNKTPKNS